MEVADALDMDHGHVFARFKDGIVAVKDKDLIWRTAIGGLKIGAFICGYNIPGANISCEFCPETVVTPAHPIFRCPGLAEIRTTL